MDSVPFQYKLVISSMHLSKCSRYDEMLPYLHMCSFTWGCSTDWLGKFFTSFPRCCAFWQLSRNEKRGVVRGNFSHCFCPLWQIIWIQNTPTLLAYVPLRWSLRQRLAYRSSEAGEGELATATAAWLLPQCVWGPLCEQARGQPLLACVVVPGCSRRESPSLPMECRLCELPPCHSTEKRRPGPSRLCLQELTKGIRRTARGHRGGF